MSTEVKAKAKKRDLALPVAPPYEVVLTLSQQVAEDLVEICGHIGGPFGGPRDSTTAIYDALQDIGVRSQFRVEWSDQCIHCDSPCTIKRRK